MVSHPMKRTQDVGGAKPPTSTTFMVWLALYIIAWLTYAGFGYSIPEAQHSEDKGGILALGAMVWAFVGWIPVMTVGYRVFFRSGKPDTPDST